MTIDALQYRFRPLTVSSASAEAATPPAKYENTMLQSTRAPNRKSEAKKRWWAEKKAREGRGD
jgi:hypothetical protein